MSKNNSQCLSCAYRFRAIDKAPCNRCFDGSNWSNETLVEHELKLAKEDNKK